MAGDPDTWTKVEIDFYLPTGWGYEYYINTDDRGAAVREVIARHEKEMNCVNHISARLTGAPNEEAELAGSRGHSCYIRNTRTGTAEAVPTE